RGGLAAAGRPGAREHGPELRLHHPAHRGGVQPDQRARRTERLRAPRIIEPGQHAGPPPDSYRTLTRTHATLSPGEMPEDPFCQQSPALPGVDLTSQIATRQVGCGPHEVWILPDGREVFVPNGAWPAFDEEMPWEEEVQEIAMAGGPVALVSRTAQ